MCIVPQLAGDKNTLTLVCPLSENFFKTGANFFLVAINRRAINMMIVALRERTFDCLPGLAGSGLPGTEPYELHPGTCIQSEVIELTIHKTILVEILTSSTGVRVCRDGSG